MTGFRRCESDNQFSENERVSNKVLRDGMHEHQTKRRIILNTVLVERVGPVQCSENKTAQPTHIISSKIV